MGHTLVDGRIGKDVYVVTDLDVHHVLAEMNGSLLPEFLGKHVARTRSDTIRVRHVFSSLLPRRKNREGME